MSSVYNPFLIEEILDTEDTEDTANEPYPVQALQFGGDLTMVALGGEVVIDSALRLKRDLGFTPVWVAGYSNDVMAYIPSKRVLKEGDYEGGGAMSFTNLPGPWRPGVEDLIIDATRDIVERLRSP